MIQATLWMNLESIMANEGHVVYDSVYMTVRKMQSHGDRKQVSRLLSEGLEKGLTAVGHKASVRCDGNVLYLNCGTYVNVFICQNAPNSTFKLV